MDPLRAEALKRQAAERAIEHVTPGMVVGLGTGSTVAHLLELLGKRLQTGELTGVTGIPTSRWTEAHAARVGIPLATFAEHDRIDLTIDGADEVSPNADLIKGMGGALLREKMVAQASERVLIIADGSKTVGRLGSLSPLPVEVVSWGHEAHVRFLGTVGADAAVRRTEDGSPFLSDNGNMILDCRFADGIPDPEALDAAVRARAGVVETGLFLGLADEALIASEDGVTSIVGRR